MDDYTRMFVPLRSNAAWFGDVDSRERLERQLKTYFILYDRIIFEGGRYRITAGIDGQGMEGIFPGNTFPGDRTKIEFFNPGDEFGVSLGGVQVLQSTSQASYEVDFLPIIHDAGLEHATCIRWSDEEMNPELKRAIGDRVYRDLSSTEFDGVLPSNRYLRESVLKALYRDSLKAHFLKAPFCVDFHVRPVVELLQQKAKAQLASEIPAAFFDYWINLDLPDFSSLPWLELCEFRESDVGQSFRRMVHSVSDRVKAVLPTVEDQRDLDHWLAREFNKELLRELAQRLTTPAKTVASICFNLIPCGIIPGIMKDVKTLHDDQTSWVSIVQKHNTRDKKTS